MTKRIRIKDRYIGGGAAITIQSMTNTRTEDVDATVAQIQRLERAGCDIVRMSVNNADAAEAVRSIRAHVKVPLVADIHFDHKLALASIRNGIDKVRINPSNIGSLNAVREVVAAAKDAGVPIRVGVNGGSLEKESIAKYGYTAEALADSALRNVALLEQAGFDDIVISAKCSDVKMNADAYRILSAKTEYPLHVGVTEAGGGDLALAKSYAGIGSLLLDGIGDTIRVSITGDPVEEVYAGDLLLKAVGIRRNFVNVVSCPTCARTEIPVATLAERIRRETAGIEKPLTVAVMGCVVNGVGEGAHADVGVAGGREKSAIMKKGKVVKVVPNERILEELLRAIEEVDHD
ncbi:MAG: flavodoxin-dependent (E)-4-hydroxy-3-methylbut-2-enyl-diphosphate synthase [Clostridia bacterium]|nr:flavodoxin-dependent (E)-4-hydroxy-3-methylbut-2-enyl-diphosphate synthase [Clostridia bacterium]